MLLVLGESEKDVTVFFPMQNNIMKSPDTFEPVDLGSNLRHTALGKFFYHSSLSFSIYKMRIIVLFSAEINEVGQVKAQRC